MTESVPTETPNTTDNTQKEKKEFDINMDVD
jgi:hypothetical protein